MQVYYQQVVGTRKKSDVEKIRDNIILSTGTTYIL